MLKTLLYTRLEWLKSPTLSDLKKSLYDFEQNQIFLGDTCIQEEKTNSKDRIEKDREIVCFKCSEVGHKSVNCKKSLTKPKEQTHTTPVAVATLKKSNPLN